MRGSPPRQRPAQPQSTFEAALCFLKPVLQRPITSLVAAAVIVCAVLAFVTAARGGAVRAEPKVSQGGAAASTALRHTAPAATTPPQSSLAAAAAEQVVVSANHLSVPGLRSPVATLTGGTTPPPAVTFVLSHGAGKDQTASYWSPLLSGPTGVFSADGAAFVAIDYPGHGNSSPAPRTAPPAVLKAAVNATHGSGCVVLVGRSWGGALAADVLASLSRRQLKRVCGVVLIAPAALRASVSGQAAAVPLLLVWEEDDFGWKRRGQYTDAFTNVTTLFLPPITRQQRGLGANPHKPELSHPQVFARAVSAWRRDVIGV